MATVIWYPNNLRNYNDPNISFDDDLVWYDWLVGGEVFDIESTVEYLLMWLPHVISEFDISDDIRYSFARRVITMFDIFSGAEYIKRRPVTSKGKIYQWWHKSSWGNARSLYWVM